MSYQKWNTEIIKRHKKETGQALAQDKPTLSLFSQDFGKLIQSYPSAVCLPESTASLQSLIGFAHQYKLPVTIRGNGLSQCGQSLPVSGGLTLSMRHFTKPLEMNDDTIWIEANTSWADLLAVSLQHHKAPFVLPYNCNLAIGGALSAGGVGSSSFKYGSISAHVSALEVVDGLGVKQVINKKSPLFHACLSGQGRFAVITKACVKLREAKPWVKTFCLVYASPEQWFEDIDKIKDKIDYMELFCSPSIQGTKLKDGKRVPMAQWLYGLHFSVEYEKKAPELNYMIAHLKPWQIINIQEETISSYFLRHNPRFEIMKMLGQWDLLHPWYECFIPTKILKGNLTELLQQLPLHYASLIHVVPMAKHKAGFLMLPEEESLCSFMILNPGIPDVFKDSCLQIIESLDACFLPQGGKRYLSGFLGQNLSPDYWSKHFGEQYASWVDLKKHYDPEGIFTSILHQ